jgi:hypothetical protein
VVLKGLVRSPSRFTELIGERKMKKLFIIIATLSFIGLAGRNTALAQITEPLTADIPFDFTVGNTNLPAGTYTLRPLNSMTADLLEFVSEDGETVDMFYAGEAQASEEPAKPELIFHRIGDRYFLHEAFDSGNRFGVAIYKTREERSLEKEMPAKESRYVTVTAPAAAVAQR